MNRFVALRRVGVVVGTVAVANGRALCAVVIIAVCAPSNPDSIHHASDIA